MRTRIQQSIGSLVLAASSVIAIAADAPAPSASTAADASWYPSRYGAEDTLGAINNLSPEKVLQAARLVRTGKTYSLGVDTGPTSPAYPPRSYSITVLQPGDGTGALMGSNQASGNDDLLHTWMGIGSQLDGLGHMGDGHRYYNGNRAQDFVTTTFCSPGATNKREVVPVDETPTSGCQRDRAPRSLAPRSGCATSSGAPWSLAVAWFFRRRRTNPPLA